MTNVGRPKKEPPPDAAQRIRELSSEGHNRISIANYMGVSVDTLRRWMTDYPELNEQFQLGREKERFDLHNMLYRKAMAGDTIAAMFLLKSQHSYREGEQHDANGGRVNITFTLPGALPMSALPVIEHGQPIPEPIALPAPGNDDT